MKVRSIMLVGAIVTFAWIAASDAQAQTPSFTIDSITTTTWQQGNPGST